jgi:hypothetical protein
VKLNMDAAGFSNVSKETFGEKSWGVRAWLVVVVVVVAVLLLKGASEDEPEGWPRIGGRSGGGRW